jgi:hypothetical protein
MAIVSPLAQILVLLPNRMSYGSRTTRHSPRPEFGNIYDYTSGTAELKAAVRHYLIEVAPEELYERFLDHIGHRQVPSGSRVEQTDFILDH